MVTQVALNCTTTIKPSLSYRCTRQVLEHSESVTRIGETVRRRWNHARMDGYDRFGDRSPTTDLSVRSRLRPTASKKKKKTFTSSGKSISLNWVLFRSTNILSWKDNSSTIKRTHSISRVGYVLIPLFLDNLSINTTPRINFFSFVIVRRRRRCRR